MFGYQPDFATNLYGWSHPGSSYDEPGEKSSDSANLRGAETRSSETLCDGNALEVRSVLKRRSHGSLDGLTIGLPGFTWFFPACQSSGTNSAISDSEHEKKRHRASR